MIESKVFFRLPFTIYFLGIVYERKWWDGEFALFRKRFYPEGENAQFWQIELL